MYLFIIYSCFKNLHKSNSLYDLIINRLQNSKCYIICGISSLNKLYEIVDDKYLYIKCGDDYNNLCEKTITICKTIKVAFPNVKGIFKCDDDIIPNILHINQLIQFVDNNNIDYLGRQIIINSSRNDNEYYVKTGSIIGQNNTYQVFKCIYAAGPLYYLSMTSVSILASATIDFTQIAAEDNMVGLILSQNNILLYPYNTYCDHLFHGKSFLTLQNYTKLNKIYVILHGGLGNQLFQAGALYELAIKHDMIPILLYKKDYKLSLTHNTHEDEFMKTIFRYFNYTYFENVDFSQIQVYNEQFCFNYDPNIVVKKCDYLIHGYFQNKKYIPPTNNIETVFKHQDLCSEILLQYPLLDNSYFIHVRIGDYAKTPTLYNFDKDVYYKKAIDYILKIDESAHFFIVSDDIRFCQNFEIFSNINKTIITEMNTLNTLYFMSLCKKGGICANSTFSGWASKLNSNINKTIICPKQWINVGYNYEIPFDYTISF